MLTCREQIENWEMDNLSEYAQKSKNVARWQPEEYDRYRTVFQQDIDKILHSESFRRLQGKTQVFDSKLNQHLRTRLTHTLEVSRIAKSMALPLRFNIDLVEAVALGHDLGHTPFGHAGEKALNTCLGNSLSFHHNVQSVWRLCTSYAGFINLDGDLCIGYNISYPTLEGIWKHTKFKSTQAEYPQVLSLLNPDKESHLEGQIVDLADGIAYLAHDLEDGLKHNILEREEVLQLCKHHLGSDFSDEKTIRYIFAEDVIEYSKDKNTVGHSVPIQTLYDELKEHVHSRLFKSNVIQEYDTKGKEIVSAIYGFCNENLEFIINKDKPRNSQLMRKYNKERVIIDYIQWLSDEIAQVVFDSRCIQ